VELFFKWIKQHLQVQSFWGYSENAVKTQIWIAMASYALVAIVKKELKFPQTMNEILQILSISLFDKTPLVKLFCMDEYKPDE
jgi:IS4 transposase